MSSNVPSFKSLAVTVPKPFVYHVEFNRPEKVNAMNQTMWTEIGQCFNELSFNPDCRVIVVSGAGKLFTAGIDVKDLMRVAPELAEAEDVARKAKILQQLISRFQASFSSMEECSKPVLAAVHSACIGAGVDFVSGVDIRYCSKDAYFQVKEVDMGMAADVGTLQRLPKIIGNQGLVRELCLTGRKMMADEALSQGLVSKVFDDKEKMMDGVLKIAEDIASKSPVAVQGIKRSLIYARDHSVRDSLDQIASWNQFMLQSDDFASAVMAQATKSDDIEFSKL
ncbi:PREDICTED: delta(3,5)-Delta(2,4)-dienoyl-CoA isomerase, mitochondrial isoform X2 [Nicrophorus vespilloides]|nr:PREDICTED: delta(3,5)-Delta(2,4)-dienoyl-CoA isomerase, mitochondrial isoform X2 [Nicrophorus vespilloides]